MTQQLNNTAFPVRVIPHDELERIDTVVGPTAKFKGDFESDASAGIRIDGLIEGSVVVPSGGIIHIGPQGRVKGGKVCADYVLIEGRVDGDVEARKAVELADSATVVGTVTYHERMDVHSLAKHKGQTNYAGDIPDVMEHNMRTPNLRAVG